MTLSWDDRKEVEAIVDKKIEELRNKTTEPLADQQPEYVSNCMDHNTFSRLEHAKKLDELDKKWSDGAARVGNLILASENYEDPDTGKDTFAWGEAMALEKEGKLPNGWRLPTAQELIKIYAELGFDANGNESGERFKALTNAETEYWWSSTSKGMIFAALLDIGNYDAMGIEYDYKDNHYPVRCVKEVK